MRGSIAKMWRTGRCVRMVAHAIAMNAATLGAAGAAVIELECDMLPDFMAEALRSLPPNHAKRMQEEWEKQGPHLSYFALDTQKRSLRLRSLDKDHGGYTWRTFSSLQQRKLSDGVIAYVYEHDSTRTYGQIKMLREMVLVIPEMKTVAHGIYWIENDGRDAGSISRGACK